MDILQMRNEANNRLRNLSGVYGVSVSYENEPMLIVKISSRVCPTVMDRIEKCLSGFRFQFEMREPKIVWPLQHRHE